MSTSDEADQTVAAHNHQHPKGAGGRGGGGRRIEQYLQQCLQQVTLVEDNNDHYDRASHNYTNSNTNTTTHTASSSGMLVVTEKERKTMVRTLLSDGTWNKAEFKARLQEFVTRRQWKQTNDFLSLYWDELQQVAQQLQEKNQPQQNEEEQQQQQQASSSLLSPFQEGLANYQRFQDDADGGGIIGPPPKKLFSFMARGREYQGKFERLLEDADKPEWLEIYRAIFEEPDERSLLRDYVEDQFLEKEEEEEEESSLLLTEEEEDHRKQLLKAAIEQELPKASPQPADGGKASGVQSELNLMTYLEQSIISASPARLQILAPVFLQSQKRRNKGGNKRTPNPKCPYTIELPPHIDLTGKTTELDALVVELLPGSTTIPHAVRIHQVWEAKATLHPMTIGDALFKKAQVLEYFVNENADDDADDDSAGVSSSSSGAAPSCSSATLQIHGQLYSILLPTQNTADNNNNNDEDESSSPSSLTTFGIFGKNLLPPAAGVRRMECVLAERLLDTSVRAVQEGLTTGRVQVPRERIQEQLERLISTAQKYQATMVVGSELQQH